MASSSSASNPLLGIQVTEKLTRQNHGMWSAQVLATLRGAKLERYVNGKAVAPAEKIDAKAADGTIVKAPNPAYEDWFVVDQQVLGFILMSLSRDILAQVAFSKTSAEAWKAIGDMFASHTRARTSNVLLALATTKKDNMTVAQYYGKMKGLADEMAAAGKPLDDDDLQTQQEGAAAVVAASRCAAQTVVVVVGKTLAVALVDLVGVALVLGVAMDSNRCHDRTNNTEVSQLVQQQPTTTLAVQFVRFDENYVPEERHVAAAMRAHRVTDQAATGISMRAGARSPRTRVVEADVPPNSTSASDFYSPMPHVKTCPLQWGASVLHLSLTQDLADLLNGHTLRLRQEEVHETVITMIHPPKKKKSHTFIWHIIRDTSMGSIHAMGLHDQLYPDSHHVRTDEDEQCCSVALCHHTALVAELRDHDDSDQELGDQHLEAADDEERAPGKPVHHEHEHTIIKAFDMLVASLVYEVSSCSEA
ncbi:hypothetical protein HU200_034497 [Digitaria exilis]|uniref:Retrotransposon gag domain-containing protein n=1 Tax=Digitaria exilis TaxID=1010633 RepID=A0A835BHL5_9POAL|nr:hypothetical protein HU200_034497 [Digitaria exilis]